MNQSLKERYKIAELIAKSLSGSATDKEKKRLQEWLQASCEHRDEYEKMVERLRTDLLSDDISDVHDSWNKLTKKLPVSARRRLFFHSFGRYAAAVVLVIAVLLTGIYYRNEKVQDKPVAAILPGTSKALLQMENGDEIEIFPDLDDIEENMLTQSVHNENGVLHYDKILVSDSIGNIYHTLTVPRGGEYMVVLSDGTKINLNSESKLKYPVAFTPSDTVRRVYVSGEAYFNVAKNKHLPFEVYTEHGNVRVYGTKFNVHNYSDENFSVITLSEGSIAFISEGKEQMLLPGEQLVYEHKTKNMNVTQVDTSVYCSWIDGIFEFNSMPLEQIMKQLSRWYDVEYSFKNESLKHYRFTGVTYKKQSLSALLKQIEKTTRIKFTIQERTIIISN